MCYAQSGFRKSLFVCSVDENFKNLQLGKFNSYNHIATTTGLDLLMSTHKFRVGSCSNAWYGTVWEFVSKLSEQKNNRCCLNIVVFMKQLKAAHGFLAEWKCIPCRLQCYNVFRTQDLNGNMNEVYSRNLSVCIYQLSDHEICHTTLKIHVYLCLEALLVISVYNCNTMFSVFAILLCKLLITEVVLQEF